MADKKPVYKKLVWKLAQTKKELEAYAFGVRIESPRTDVMIGDNLTTWFLSFYPRGNDGEDKDGVGLYLCLAEAGSKAFKARFTLGVVGMKGNEEGNAECPGKSFAVGHGYPCLLKQNELFNLKREYFIDDKLTLYCKLTISNDVIKKDFSDQNILSDIKKMLDEELFTDVDVETSDKKVLKAHKGVLAARSPYFYAMLTSGMKGAEVKVVKVREKAAIMEAVLSFIYSGKVENLNVNARELVFVAQKYQLNELKELCIERIVKTVSCKNVVITLLAAKDLTDSDELKKRCISMIASNFEFLSTTADWEIMTPKLLSEITLHIISEIEDTINL